MKKNEELQILSEAAKEDCSNVIKYVLDHRKPSEQLKEDMQTALVIAAARNYISTGSELIKHGADVNFGACKTYINRDEAGRPPIFNAVECGSLEFIEMLISEGADINVFSERGYTVLVAAYYDAVDHSKSDDVLELLLERGADPFLGGERISFSEVFQQKMRDQGSIMKNTLGAGKNYIDGQQLFCYWNKYGIKLRDRMLIPPYFTSCIDLLPYATYFFHEGEKHKNMPEVILLHEDVRGNAVQMAEISDCYSSCAEVWLYDEGRDFFLVERRMQEKTTAERSIVFKNGMYYIFDVGANNCISKGYTHLLPVNKEILIYRLYSLFGYVSWDGEILTEPIFTHVQDWVYKNSLTGYIDRTLTDRYQISCVYRKNHLQKLNIKEERVTLFRQNINALIRPFILLFYKIVYGNPEKLFIKTHITFSSESKAPPRDDVRSEPNTGHFERDNILL